MVDPGHRYQYNAASGVWLFWDAEREQWFYYHPRADLLMYPDRSSTQRPSDVPASYYLDPRSQNNGAQTRLPQYDVTQAGSPPKHRSSAYTYDRRDTGNDASSSGRPSGAPDSSARQATASGSRSRQLQKDANNQPLSPGPCPGKAPQRQPSQPVNVPIRKTQRGESGGIPRGPGSLPVNTDGRLQVGSAPRSYGTSPSSGNAPGNGGEVRASLAEVTAGMAGATLRDTPTGPVHTSVRNVDGIRTVYAANARTHVRTAFQTGPQEKIGDPALLRSNIPTQRRYIDTGNGEVEILFPDFYVRKPSGSFFVVGRVLMMLWAEPAGEGTAISATAPSDRSIVEARFSKEKILSKVRRFVVIRAGGEDFCTAIPIVSYGSQGCGKRGVVKSQHAIIHSTKVPPAPLPNESPRPNEAGLRRHPIRVVMDNPRDDELNIYSRLHFSRVSTIQHNVKVKAVGMVHPSSMGPLLSQFRNVWMGVDDTSDEDSSSSDDSDRGRNTKSKKAVTAKPNSKGKPTLKGNERETDTRSSRTNGEVRRFWSLQGSGGGGSASRSSKDKESARENRDADRRNVPTNSTPATQYSASINRRAAMWARDSVTELLEERGMRMDQAVQHLALRLQASTPGETYDAALQEVQGLLAQSNAIIAQEQHSAGRYNRGRDQSTPRTFSKLPRSEPEDDSSSEASEQSER